MVLRFGHKLLLVVQYIIVKRNENSIYLLTLYVILNVYNTEFCDF